MRMWSVAVDGHLHQPQKALFDGQIFFGIKFVVRKLCMTLCLRRDWVTSMQRRKE